MYQNCSRPHSKLFLLLLFAHSRALLNLDTTLAYINRGRNDLRLFGFCWRARTTWKSFSSVIASKSLGASYGTCKATKHRSSAVATKSQTVSKHSTTFNICLEVQEFLVTHSIVVFPWFGLTWLTYQDPGCYRQILRSAGS